MEDEQPRIVCDKLLLVKDFLEHIEAKDVIFDTILLWIGFKGLERENYKRPIIWIITSAVGEVDEIFPKDIVPRTFDFYHAKVKVKVSALLLE